MDNKLKIPKFLEPGKTCWWTMNDSYQLIDFGFTDDFANGIKEGAVKAISNLDVCRFVVNFKTQDGENLKVFNATMSEFKRRMTLLECLKCWWKCKIKDNLV